MGTLALPVPGYEPRDFTSLHPTLSSVKWGWWQCLAPGF